jgi:hypothetical protein
MKQALLSLFAAVVLLTSCSEDIDLTADYRETMVIYGLLDPNASTQYVRISKAFLGEGNTLLMAQQSDSINYADVLEVRLERLLNNVVVNTYPMTRIDTIPKESGAFAAPYQVIYATTQRILTDGSFYRIVVRNTQTGTEASSTTRIVGGMQVFNPSPTVPVVDFAAFGETRPRIKGGDNGRYFGLVMRFHYLEIDSLGSVTQHFADWTFPDQLTSQTGEMVEFVYQRQDFYRIIGAQIPVRSGVTRKLDTLTAGRGPLEFRFYSATEDVYTYQQLVNPSNTGVVQDRPSFTTVENGLGLFSSRILQQEYRNLTSNSKAAFDTSAYTRNLNFSF